MKRLPALALGLALFAFQARAEYIHFELDSNNQDRQVNVDEQLTGNYLRWKVNILDNDALVTVTNATLHYYPIPYTGGTVQVTGTISATNLCTFTATEALGRKGTYGWEVVASPTGSQPHTYGRGTFKVEPSYGAASPSAMTMRIVVNYALFTNYLNVAASGPYRAGTNVTFTSNTDGSQDINVDALTSNDLAAATHTLYSQAGGGGSGDITAVNITAGTGLTGTVSTASGGHTQTLALAAASVASLLLADGSYQPNTAAFTNAVQAAQTNDGYEADTDTTYTAGTNLDLNGTEFDLDSSAVASLALADSALQAANTSGWVTASHSTFVTDSDTNGWVTGSHAAYLLKAGDTMSGNLTISKSTPVITFIDTDVPSTNRITMTGDAIAFADATSVGCGNAILEGVADPTDVDHVGDRAYNDARYATTAQGSTADTATQPGDAVTTLDGTANRVLYVDASGDVTELALGASGTYLKSQGASSAPAFDTPSGSGFPLSANADFAGYAATNMDYIVMQTNAAVVNPPAGQVWIGVVNHLMYEIYYDGSTYYTNSRVLN